MRRLSVFVSLGLLLCAAGARAGTISVPAGGNLQQAINQAQPGDTILLAAGATFTGNFVLPAKNGTSYITIRSSAPDSSLPAPGQRMTPAYASYLPKLQAPAGAGGTPPLATQPYASYYLIEFIEFLPNPSGTGALLALGSADSTQNSLSVVPHHITVDRCYLHSYPGQAQLRGIALNSGDTTISNNYISEIKYAGNDSQAIAGWNGPGPYTITNNYLQAAGENFLMGGSSMFIPNCTPTNIQFRNNYVTKDPSWRGSSWTVKNIFELKHAQDVTVDGNVFEYIWLAAQPGYAIVITPRNQYKDNPWTVVQRVSFTNNIVRHVSSAWNILGWDDESANQNIQTNHLTFRNNVLEDVSSANWGGAGRLMLISQTPYVTVDHNTAFNSDSAIYAYNGPSDNFVFTNNIVNTSSYGITGDSVGGNAATAINTYFPGSTFLGNLFVACSASYQYPAGNSFPSSYSGVGFVNLSGGDYHLSSSSSYKGKATDGKDPGADIDALTAAQGGSAPPPPPPSDSAPSVSLTAPAAGGAYSEPATIQCSANASDSDSTPVARVDFYANGALVGTATSSPFTYTWWNVAAGSYTVKAVATDTAGLQATSGAVTITVAATASLPLPSPWVDADIGTAGVAGSASFSNGSFTVRGAGADVWGTADSFNYVYQPLAGDGTIVARVVSLQNTNVYAKAGVMVRATLDAGSADAILDVKPGGGLEFMARASAGGSTSVAASPTGSAPIWLKLVRSGNTVTASSSADGSSWTAIGSTSLTLPSTVYVGLAVCSHDTSTLGTATFDNVGVALPSSPPVDQAPSVAIAAPAAGASFTAPATISVSATASDADATPVARVDFYANGTAIGTATSAPYTISWANVPAGSYSLTAVAADAGGLKTTSSAVAVTVAPSPSGPPPTPWVEQDIGSVGQAGSVAYANGVFTIKGAGADIWGTADSFLYVHQPLAGNGTIVARVLSLQNTDTYAKAGVMFRTTLDAGSADVLLDVKPGGGLEFMSRATAGGSTSMVANPAGAAPVWLKLVRNNNTVIASMSTDGAAWTTIATTTIAFPSAVYVGLAVCSHNVNVLNTATFDNVSVTPASTTTTDQAPSVAITAPASGASFTAPAAISISASASDADATPVARVDFYANGAAIGSATSAPYTLSWTNVAAGSYSLTAVATDSAGLQTVSATVSVTVASAAGGGTAPAPLPSPWVDQDVGTVGVAGSAGYSNGIFTVKGAGADIWGSADAFNFVYQPLNNDGQIVARVLSVQNTSPVAKAGITIRQSLGATAPSAVLDLTPGGFEFLARTSAGGATTMVASGAATPGVWLKLIRSGKTIAAYSSADAISWTAIGSTTAAGSGKVYVGLAVCSHDTSQLTTATFDQVAVSTTKAQPRKVVSYTTLSKRKQVLPK